MYFIGATLYHAAWKIKVSSNLIRSVIFLLFYNGLNYLYLNII